MSHGIKPTPFPEPVGGSGVLGQTGIGSASSSNSDVGGKGNSLLKPTPFPEPNGSGSPFGGFNKGGVNIPQQSMSPGIKPTLFPEPLGGNGVLGQTGIGSASSSNSVIGSNGNSLLKPTPFPEPSGPGSLFGEFNKGGVNMSQQSMSSGIKPTPFPEPVGGSGVLGQTGIGSASSSNSVVGGNGNSFLKPTPFPEPSGPGSLFVGYNKGGVNIPQQSMSPGIKPTPFPEPIGGGGVLGQTGIGSASSSNSVIGSNGNSLLKPNPFPEPSGSGSLSNELDVVQNNEVHRPSRIMERPKPIQVESPRYNTPQITYHQTNKRRDRFGR